MAVSACSASVDDANGNPVPDETISPTSDCASLSGVSNGGDGTYSFTASDLTTAGDCDVNAAVGVILAPLNDTFTITVNAGATANVDFSVDTPVSVDTGYTTAYATFTDANGNTKPGLTVAFTAGHGTVGATSDDGNGDYSATISALTVAGTYSASVSGDGVGDSTSFTVTAGAPASLTITGATSPVPPDGSTPSYVDFSIVDQYGNGLAGLSPSVVTTLGTVTGTSDLGGGSYQSTVVSSTGGTATVTASLGGLSDSTTVLFESVCDNDPDPAGGTNGCPIVGSIEVTVIYDTTKTPVAGAFVQVGDAPGDPFSGNSGYADASGVITFSDGALSGPITVTAGIEGSSTWAFKSIAEVDASEIVIPLNQQVRTATDMVQISGTISGIDNSNNDGNLDAGIVVPSLTMDDLLALNLDTLLAPDVTRSIPLVGDTAVPGNIYVPSQRELYVLTFEFTPYYQQVERNTPIDVFCLSGRVPVSDVLDILQNGGELSDIIGLLTFKEAGLLGDQTFSGPTGGVNFGVTNTVSSNLTVNVGNLPAGAGEIYVASVADIDNLGGLGQLVPMGFNIVTGSGSPQVTTITKSGAFASYNTIAGVAALAATGSGISTQVQRSGLEARPATATVNSFFNIISGMTQAGTDLSFNDPESATSVGFDLQLSSVYLDMSTPLYKWDVLADDVAFTLPTLPSGVSPLVSSQIYAWEASAFGLTLNGSFDYNEFAFDDYREWLTHFTYNKAFILAP